MNYEQLPMFAKYRSTCPICGAKFYAVKQKNRQVYCDRLCRIIAEKAGDFAKANKG